MPELSANCRRVIDGEADYVLCVDCIAETGKRGARDSGLGVLVSFVVAASAFAFVVTQAPPDWFNGDRDGALVLGALGVLATLMVAMTLALGQTSAQIDEQDAEGIRADGRVVLTRLTNLRRLDGRLGVEFSLTMSAIVFAGAMAGVALRVGGEGERLTLLTLAVLCVGWSGSQLIVVGQNQLRSNSLRAILDEAFTRKIHKRLDGIRASSRWWIIGWSAAWVLTPAVPLFFAHGLQGEWRMAMIGVEVAIFTAVLLFWILPVVASSGVAEAGISRGAPVLMAALLAVVVVSFELMVMARGDSGNAGPWAVLVTVLVHLVLGVALALGAGGVWVLKAVAQRFVGLSEGISEPAASRRGPALREAVLLVVPITLALGAVFIGGGGARFLSIVLVGHFVAVIRMAAFATFSPSRLQRVVVDLSIAAMILVGCGWVLFEFRSTPTAGLFASVLFGASTVLAWFRVAAPEGPIRNELIIAQVRRDKSPASSNRQEPGRKRQVTCGSVGCSNYSAAVHADPA
uniref:hypothetical protein n=1 Tax=Tessaracoccus bendigoensis TaxID=72764 RepID=UPI001114F32E|nr:hypothetical protein [Tessaracoccus bendigoensis]